MYLGIDYGKKRIGVAIGSIFPKPLVVIDGSKSKEQILDNFRKIAETEEIEGMVFGLPEKDDSNETGLNLEIKKIAKYLGENLNIPIHFEPEQFTSTEAERILKKYGVSVIDNKEKIDKLSAVIILEQFLERKKSEQK